MDTAASTKIGITAYLIVPSPKGCPWLMAS
jgi:hypothetical protein